MLKGHTRSETEPRIRRRDLLIAGAGVATAPLLGRRSWAATEPVRFGWVGPLSPPGGYAEGILMKDAAVMAAAAINGQGGILGRPVEIVYADTRGMPAEGVAAAERLVVEDKVIAVFGEFHSSVALAEMEVFHKYGIPFMACDVWSDKITGKQYPEVFRNSTTVSLLFTMIGDWIAASGFKNVASLVEKDDNGLASQQAVAAALKRKKALLTAVDADPSLTDFTAQLLRFKSKSPPFDFFFVEFSEAGAYSLVRDAHALGFAPTTATGMYLSGGPAVDPTFWKNVGGAGKYLLTENVGLPKAAFNNKTKAFVAAFKQRYHNDPPGAAMESYDAAWLLAEAVKASGGTSGPGIIKALETIDWTGVRGRYQFSTHRKPAWAYHQFMKSPATIIQYDTENQSPFDAPIVWPRRFANVPYLYKRPGA